MAKNNNITNAQALACAIAALRGETVENLAEVTAKLEHMAAVANKPKKGSGTPSKDTLKREAEARAVVEQMRAIGEPVSTVWMRENIRGLNSTQKVTGAMRTADRLGLVGKEKRKDGTYYWAL